MTSVNLDGGDYRSEYWTNRTCKCEMNCHNVSGQCKQALFQPTCDIFLSGNIYLILKHNLSSNKTCGCMSGYLNNDCNICRGSQLYIYLITEWLKLEGSSCPAPCSGMPI